MRRILIYGAGEHGRVVCETLLQRPGIAVAGFIDDAMAPGTPVMGRQVLGGFDAVRTVAREELAVALGCGSVRARLAMADRVRDAGLSLLTVVDPSAVVAASASIGAGTFVGPRAVIHTAAQVGTACIINSGAIVEHDCRIGDGAEVSVGALLGGGVTVGRGSFVAIGAVVRDHLTIGAGTTVGAGAVVVKDLPAGVVAYGVPARIARDA